MGFCEKATAGCNYTSCCVELNWGNHLICFGFATSERKRQGGNAAPSPPRRAPKDFVRRDHAPKSILTDNAVQVKEANL